MSDINLWELSQTVTKLSTTVDKIDHDLYGNGRPGFISEVSDMISQGKGMLKLIACLGFIITILVGILTVRSFLFKAANETPSAFHSSVNKGDLSDGQ